MQVDTVSVYARELLPAMTAVKADGVAGKALDLLRGWNGDMAADQPQPLIWNAWTARLRADLEARAGLPKGTYFNHLEWLQLVVSGGGGQWCGGDCGPLLAEGCGRGAWTACTARRSGASTTCPTSTAACSASPPASPATP